VTVLRDLSKGVADLPLAEVARVAQELLVKQMRQSFQSEQSPDEDPWPVRKRPSFAGVLKLSRKALLHYKATGETKFFGRDALPWSESFLAQRAYSIVARGKATETYDVIVQIGHYPRTKDKTGGQGRYVNEQQIAALVGVCPGFVGNAIIHCFFNTKPWLFIPVVGLNPPIDTRHIPINEGSFLEFESG